ncbi:MAG: hypothetical protein KDA47_01595 [Planctomycetales bacterium]|nr:hypothetical protein [Planctomycetales bacterium]
MRMAVFFFVLSCWFVPCNPIWAEQASKLEKLPANVWTLLHSEQAEGGKTFARAVYVPNIDRLYLWGTGGEQPARNVYRTYELESFAVSRPGWISAFPTARNGDWTAENYPPFRIYGQTGPDGLKFDEGPRLRTVGGYNSTNRVQWWDFDGVPRPSPVLTFNMACYDSLRNRILYYADGVTFALDPTTNSWTDLKATNYPITCRTLAWGSMCYDPIGDRVMLFGGGLATNPSGGAPTWFYDCKENRWERPKLDAEPPLRCNSPIVYDATTKSLVMFGGYNQAAALNDTWVYELKADRWQRRDPPISPPPMYAPATVALSNLGKVLVCESDARKLEMHHLGRTSAQKETWIYDVAENSWTPLNSDLRLENYRWLTAAPSGHENVALLVAFGPERRTYAFRYDFAAAPVDLPGAAPNVVAWKYPEQKRSLENAPPPDRARQIRLLKSLPVNTFVDAAPPGMLISKTWSTAVIDSDRSEVIYTGGGHSGYSGNDFARYSIANNRWSLDMPPRFPPYLESTNAGIFGWSYGMLPFSQHTYLWYCYDPASRTVVYLARPSIDNGLDIQLSEDPADTFTYDASKHGYASWVYDVETKTMRRPSFGREFANPWHLSLIGTPRGVYAVSDQRLYHGRVERESGRVDWTLVDANYPRPRTEIKYHYEYQPLLYDSKRERLIQLKGDAQRVDIFVRSLEKDGAWQQLETQGTAAIGREAVYIPEHDGVLWLGNELYWFDCGDNTMRRVDVELPKGLYGHECAFVFDAPHNVCVALIPERFTGPMQTFLFRFDPAAAKLDR